MPQAPRPSAKNSSHVERRRSFNYTTGVVINGTVHDNILANIGPERRMHMLFIDIDPHLN